MRVCAQRVGVCCFKTHQHCYICRSLALSDPLLEFVKVSDVLVDRNLDFLLSMLMIRQMISRGDEGVSISFGYNFCAVAHMNRERGDIC